MAIAKGEWFGSGLGGGVAKLKFLPEPHTDFLFATIGEELGMVGMLAIVFLFYWIVRRCFEIGRQAISFDLLLQRAGRPGRRAVARRPGVHQPRRQPRAAADQGADPAVHELGRQRDRDELRGVAIVLRIDFENRRLMRGTVL